MVEWLLGMLVISILGIMWVRIMNLEDEVRRLKVKIVKIQMKVFRG